MTTYTSAPTLINKAPEYWFNFFADMRNFKSLLPEDKISDWEAEESRCRFQIKGLTKVAFAITEKTPHTKVVYGGSEKMPIPLSFVMDIQAVPGQTNQSTVVLKLETELNAMMKMMLEKPLSNLVQTIASKLPELAEKI